MPTNRSARAGSGAEEGGDCVRLRGANPADRTGHPLRALIVLLPLAALDPARAEIALCREPPADSPIPDIAFEEVVRGLDHPTHITAAHDGSRRLYVVEQAGTIRLVENGRLRPEPFLDIRDRVTSGGEKGLLGLAFHPRYRDNGYFYVNYTTRRGGGRLVTHVSRFVRRDARRADPGSELVLLEIDQPYDNHNGGQIAFGPDGYLYIGMGDGGSANDPHGHGQNLATLLGALLRIDVDRVSSGRRYGIPPDNPFVGRPDARPEIYAYGLRNPWRFSFDAATGRLYLADVGQDAVEEIDVIEKGGNYGWNVMEGDICTPGVNPHCVPPRGYVPPLHVYRHPAGFSVTGGFVYRGRAIPELCGVYLFADYVTRRVWGLRDDAGRVRRHRELLSPALAGRLASRVFNAGLPAISSFGEDEERELYVADHEGGRLLKIVAAPRRPE